MGKTKEAYREHRQTKRRFMREAISRRFFSSGGLFMLLALNAGLASVAQIYLRKQETLRPELIMELFLADVHTGVPWYDPVWLLKFVPVCFALAVGFTAMGYVVRPKALKPWDNPYRSERV